ncbi:hypothetical protein [Streptomyces sp. NPDC092370]|uniref:hypothetical protein n=1 Tax=Streptomyces sp. NPDC092370 TaxID=3366016 RepID=UPI0037FB057C
MADLFAKALTMGGTGLGLARRPLASTGRTGQAPQDTSAPSGAGPEGADGRQVPRRA